MALSCKGANNHTGETTIVGSGDTLFDNKHTGETTVCDNSSPNPELEALYKKGEDYYSGRGGVEKDYTKAVEYFRKAAEQGYHWAQYNLGNCYYNGYGVTKDHAEATKWYRKAAEQGNEDAKKELNNPIRKHKGLIITIIIIALAFILFNKCQ